MTGVVPKQETRFLSPPRHQSSYGEEITRSISFPGLRQLTLAEGPTGRSSLQPSYQHSSSDGESFFKSSEKSSLNLDSSQRWQNHPLVSSTARSLSKVRVGMNFLRDIADMSLEHASAFHNLRLHIPHTLVPAKELMWLSSDNDGRLSVSSDFEIKHFIEKVEHIERKSSLKKEQEYLSGHAFILKRDTPQETVTRLIEWEEVRKLESGVDMEYIVQHYISSSKASSTTTRLFFFNPSSKAFSNKRSFGLTLSLPNSKEAKYTKVQRGSPQRGHHNLPRPKTEGSRLIQVRNVKVQGRALIPYYEEAILLSRLIQRCFGVSVGMMVADFIKDTGGKVWFLWLKFVRPDTLVTPNYRIREGARRKMLNCMVCAKEIESPSNERLVTLRMLRETKNHMLRRGQTIQPLVQVELQTKHSSCKVCELCYMLVTAELELMEVSRLCAIYQSIPVNTIQAQNKKESLDRELINPTNSSLIQWRVLIYIRQLFDTSMADIIEAGYSTANIYLHIRIFQYVTSWKIYLESAPTRYASKISREHTRQILLNDIRSSLLNINPQLTKTIQSEQPSPSFFSESQEEIKDSRHIPLEKLRVMYFFSKTEDIEVFRKNTEVEVRITDGEGWEEELLAIGSCVPFKALYESEASVLLKRINVPIQLFSPKLNNFLLKADFGLNLDGMVVAPTDTLRSYNEVEFPPDSFYACNKLPLEWLELLLPSHIEEKKIEKHLTSIYTDSVSSFSGVDEMKQRIYLKSSSSMRVSPNTLDTAVENNIMFTNKKLEVLNSINAEHRKALKQDLHTGQSREKLQENGESTQQNENRINETFLIDESADPLEFQTQARQLARRQEVLLQNMIYRNSSTQILRKKVVERAKSEQKPKRQTVSQKEIELKRDLRKLKRRTQMISQYESGYEAKELKPTSLVRVKEKNTNQQGQTEVIFNFKQRKYEDEQGVSPNRRSSHQLGRYNLSVAQQFTPEALAIIKGYIKQRKKAKQGDVKSTENSSLVDSDADLRTRPININDLLRQGKDMLKSKRDLVFKTIHFWKKSTEKGATKGHAYSSFSPMRKVSNSRSPPRKSKNSLDKVTKKKSSIARESKMKVTISQKGDKDFSKQSQMNVYRQQSRILLTRKKGERRISKIVRRAGEVNTIDAIQPQVIEEQNREQEASLNLQTPSIFDRI